MGKSKAPAPPDPRQTAAAQTGTNIGTAIAGNTMQMVDQVTPYGSLTYETTGMEQYTDPYTGKTYDIPRYQATTSLSEAEQAIQEQDDIARQNLAGIGAQQSGFLGDYLAEPFQYGTGEHERWAMGLYDDLSRDRLSEDRGQLHTQLTQQGLQPGSQAYDRAMQNMLEAQGSSRNQFLLDSYGQGFSSAQAQRNQPINEITALLSGSQVNQPGVALSQPGGPATTDVAGIINQNYNQRLGAWNQEQQRKQQLFGGLFGAGATLLGGW